MINLDKLPDGASWRDNKMYTKTTVVQLEVLSKHKMPMDGVSCERGNKYRCPVCREYTLELSLDSRCTTLHCNSRVIKYKKLDTEETVTHDYYDIYVSRFYEDVERRRKRIAKKVTRDVKSPEESNR
tara:strand:+ start:38 stop:418 length:381 start_codon:yes stop_codon:yes gene_type:complete